MRTDEVDYLVIGSGVAGLRAAIELSKHGSVFVITKDTLKESCTEYAQGGVAAALSDEDTITVHFEDTIKAGDGCCNDEAVHVLVQEGPERIRELIDWGAEFDKNGTKLSFTLEGAHSRKRVLHSYGDSTGRELERVLINKVKKLENVKKYDFAYFLDFIVESNKCFGAYVIKDDNIHAVLSKATVVATGGGGQIFSRTTNPMVATGDGIAAAYRAGVVLKNMELIQFHPTSLYAPRAPQFLLSEALRGEGAKLLNVQGSRFTLNYHQDGELAPRDVVSRAIVYELERTACKQVFLDITHLEKDFVKNRFPRIYTTCLKYDIDITSERIPVTPAAHFFMGGIATDTRCQTNIEGLYAAGEVACTGVHGANRLASNSLLEGLVFGQKAGLNASYHKKTAAPVLKTNMEFSKIKTPDEALSRVRKTMWKKVGIIRDGESLLDAIESLERLTYLTTKIYGTRFENEIKNMIQTASLIALSAYERRCSIGAHYRSDYPDKCRKEDLCLKKDPDSFKTKIYTI